MMQMVVPLAPATGRFGRDSAMEDEREVPDRHRDRNHGRAGHRPQCGNNHRRESHYQEGPQ